MQLIAFALAAFSVCRLKNGGRCSACARRKLGGVSSQFKFETRLTLLFMFLLLESVCSQTTCGNANAANSQNKGDSFKLEVGSTITDGRLRDESWAFNNLKITMGTSYLPYSQENI
jgi:hypothetical protein